MSIASLHSNYNSFWSNSVFLNWRPAVQWSFPKWWVFSDLLPIPVSVIPTYLPTYNSAILLKRVGKFIAAAAGGKSFTRRSSSSLPPVPCSKLVTSVPIWTRKQCDRIWLNVWSIWPFFKGSFSIFDLPLAFGHTVFNVTKLCKIGTNSK